MALESSLYLPLNLHKGTVSVRKYAPMLDAVPPNDGETEIFVLAHSNNFMKQGLYLLKNKEWQALLPQPMVSEVFTQGLVADVYIDLEVPTVVDPGCTVFKNGILVVTQVLEGAASYCVLTPTQLSLDSNEFVYVVAAQNLSGHRVVKAVDGGADYASIVWADDYKAVIGLTAGATLAGQFAKIQISGELVEPSWNWQLGPVFNGVDGLLTQNNPSSGYSLIVGIAIEPTKLLISVKQPIVLT